MFDAFCIDGTKMPLHSALILLFIAVTTDAVDSSINPFDICVFGDFLRGHHLNHATIVIVGDAEISVSRQLRQVLRENAVSFYRTKYGNFQTQFTAKFSRVGVAMLEFNGEVLKSFATNELLGNDQAWLILLENRQGLTGTELISEAFVEINMNIDADVTVGLRHSSGDSVMLYDVYRVCHICGSPLRIQRKGYWSLAEGYKLEAAFREPYTRRRRNFGNATINAGVAITAKPTHLSYEEYLENAQIYQEYDDMQRKTYHLMLMMEPQWNLRFNVTIRKEWGVLINGSWNGVLRDILDGRVDLSLSPLRLTTDRLTILDFSSVVHKEPIAFLFRHPRHSSIRNIFLSPLSTTVWLALCALVVLTILLLAILLTLERRGMALEMSVPTATTINSKTTTMAPNERTPLEMRADFIMLTVWEALCIQGPDPVIFRAPSTRTLVFSVCLFSVLLQQFYAAFIVGSLLLPEPRTITTLSSLYNSSLDIGMENYYFQHEIFNLSGAMGRAIYTNRICRSAATNILALREGVQRIAHGGFAYHTATDRAYRLLKSTLKDAAFCDLQAIPLNPPVTAPLGWRKRWPLREYFANSVLHYRSSGLMQYNDKQWEAPHPDCQLSATKEVQVDMEHFLPAIMVLALAMLISVLVLLIELAIKKYSANGRYTTKESSANMRSSNQ